MQALLVRPMTVADAEDVRGVDREAFATYRQGHGRAPTLTRTPEVVAWNLAKDPEGCFVAEVDGRVVGHVFSRRWGVIGWTGTFGVVPEFQGRGVGRALFRRSRAHLAGSGCRFIGLETMPDSVANLGFYLSEGYRLDGFSLTWHKALTVRTAPADRACSSHWGSGAPWTEALTDLAATVLPGLDLAGDAAETIRRAMGDLLLVALGGRVVAAALVRLRPLALPLEEGPGGHSPADQPANVEFLLVRPGAPLQPVLVELEHQLRVKGTSGLTLPANSADLAGARLPVERLLLREDYRVLSSGVRLLAGDQPAPAGTVWWRWSG